jgi:hypothetical protein
MWPFLVNWPKRLNQPETLMMQETLELVGQALLRDTVSQLETPNPKPQTSNPKPQVHLSV